MDQPTPQSPIRSPAQPAPVELTVVDVVVETPQAHSISFAVPEHASEAFSYRPGQFLTLAVPSERDGVAARCYSLSSSPYQDGPLTVTVKRTVDGYASNWMCDRLHPGDRVAALPPAGVFVPRDLDADLLLLAGSSGITPLMSILRSALAVGSGRLVLGYGNRDEESTIFARALEELAAAHPERLRVVHWLESEAGVPTPAQVHELASGVPTYDGFVCGSPTYTAVVTTVLRELGFPRSRRHQERFVSLEGDPFAAAASV